MGLWLRSGGRVSIFLSEWGIYTVACKRGFLTSRGLKSSAFYTNTVMRKLLRYQKHTKTHSLFHLAAKPNGQLFI